MVAVSVACLAFAVLRLLVSPGLGQVSPWWVNAGGLVAIASIATWFRRAPEARAVPAANLTAITGTLALVVPIAMGLHSSAWWLSLIGFTMVLLGRRLEAWAWGIATALLATGAAVLFPEDQPSHEAPLESALSQVLFVLILLGIAAAIRSAADRRARARERSAAEASQLAEALRESRQMLRLVLDNIPQLVFWKDRRSTYLGCNLNFAAAAGVASPEAIAGLSDLDLPWKSTEAEKYRLDDQEVMASGQAKLRFAETQFMADGRVAHVETSKIPLRDASGVVVGVLGTYEDVTQRQLAAQRIQHLAYHDSLTGLPNRLLLEDRLARAVAAASRHGRRVAVLFIDLDSFKAVNDRHGHDRGDELLREVARRLAAATRAEDTVARLGGDEFVVVLAEAGGRAEVVHAVERVLAAIRAPVQLGPTQLTFTASLGVAVYPDRETGGADLLRCADAAMYQAKEQGRDRAVFYDPSAAAGVPVHHHAWEAVAGGFAEGQFVLVYQPTVNLRTGAIVGAEALLRWARPGHGLLTPAAFIPEVERTELIVGIGAWVLEEALSELERWRARGLDLRLGVNVAARQLQDPGFFEVVRAALERHRLVTPDQLELEILETTALDDLGSAQATMERCRELGVRFCLDDFGTGYASLSYLKRLPVDVVKIDQSFVRDMLRDREDLAIVEGVLTLSRIFGREVVAEGVDDPGHVPVLLGLGCVLAQGYHFARPMPGEAFIAFAEAWATQEAVEAPAPRPARSA
jgi:diguanylate cyclase (GGDEF)-like protein/PAS domain S-box-containing protein